ncbi:MBL fold metallo-hydrolase [Planococcus maitriensis]|uniref:MBL fold metallo-hydrolase n=2 Tax=Planococcus maitriensis TaxID=221799 RepID=A0A365K3Z4_9BACL|nr:MBL fold metallo-hydrolase [Planococcus maitriensis]RAZ67324.1 MBL fold metallo-hydrolase [Planococcus maitriensis]
MEGFKMLKKRAEAGEKNKVSYLNGTIQFRGISLNVYSYLADGVLIDTGARSLRKYFEPFIDRADFDQVVLTHYHEDHSGNAAHIERTRNTPIYLSGKTIDACAQAADYPLYRKLFWGKRKPFHANALPDSFTSRNATWDVIATPGHAHDHQAFFNRDTGQMFTGDLFVNERTKVVLAEENIPQLITSLERVLRYDFGDVFCSHAGFVEGGRQALERKRDYLLGIQQDAFALRQQGYGAKEIRDRLLPKTYPITTLSRGEWDSLHLITSLLEDSR